jgi:hypothetical protein
VIDLWKKPNEYGCIGTEKDANAYAVPTQVSPECVNRVTRSRESFFRFKLLTFSASLSDYIKCESLHRLKPLVIRLLLPLGKMNAPCSLLKGKLPPPPVIRIRMHLRREEEG